MKPMKKILGKYTSPPGHWVGDGFPVRSLLSYGHMGADSISPFLLLDYAGPTDFPPANERRGVGQHPHRGFETVTLVYKGELEHRDSTGAGGTIGEGDVQWMTAGGGIVHEEFHSSRFTEEGGTLEMVQLWVNLPARNKDAPANYQTLLKPDIPTVPLGDNHGQLRVVSGEYRGHTGPAQTFTPINVWDIRLNAGDESRFEMPEGHTALLILLSGAIQLHNGETLSEPGVVNFAREGTDIHLETNHTSHLLVLTGEPLNEPVVGYGPFVMNTSKEIEQAVMDFRSGQFGRVTG